MNNTSSSVFWYLWEIVVQKYSLSSLLHCQSSNILPHWLLLNLAIRLASPSWWEEYTCCPLVLDAGRHDAGRSQIWASWLTMKKGRSWLICWSKEDEMSVTEEWINKMWCIYKMEYYSAIKKNEIMPFAEMWMELEIAILSEASQRRRNIIWHPLYVKSKKKWYRWRYLQNKNGLTDLENELMIAGGKYRGKDS